MKFLSRRLISLVTCVLALGLTLASNPLPAQAAGAIYVDDSIPPCHAGAYTSIQSAVNAALPGPRKITVCAGIYQGPITINGANKLKLIAKPGVTLVPDVTPFATNMIDVTDSSNVTIQGFTIDGQSSLDSLSNETYEVAIHYWFSSGTITKNTIQNWHTPGYVSSGDALIRGISAGDNQGRKVTISKNTITNFQGVGIEIREMTKTVVTKNTLTTPDDGPDLLAGIAAWSGYYGQLTGTITKNQITTDAFPGSTNAYGLFLFNVSNFKISGNTITGWTYGMRLAADCPISGQADNLKVTGNKINETAWGIWLRAAPQPGCGGVDAHADNAKITGNKITNTTVAGGYGIIIQASGSNPPNGLIQNAKVTGNTITHFINPIYSNNSTGSVITGKFTPNKILP